MPSGPGSTSPRAVAIARRASSSPPAASWCAWSIARVTSGSAPRSHCEQARALQLQRERGEGMGEHVVHLPREPGALRDRGGLGLGGARGPERVSLGRDLAHQSHDEEPRHGGEQHRSAGARAALDHRDRGDHRDREGEGQDAGETLEPERGDDPDQERPVLPVPCGCSDGEHGRRSGDADEGGHPPPDRHHAPRLGAQREGEEREQRDEDESSRARAGPAEVGWRRPTRISTSQAAPKQRITVASIGARRPSGLNQ